MLCVNCFFFFFLRCMFGVMNFVVKQHCNVLVKNDPTTPLETHRVPAFQRRRDVPVLLRCERLYFVVPGNTEPQCWRLARPKRDEIRVQVPVLVPEKEGLEACEGNPNPKVNLLSCVHRKCLVFVRNSKVLHCCIQVLRCNGFI